MNPISDSTVAIDFRDVTYSLGNGRSLVRELNLQITRGETIVLLGRSGSGKTTALKLVNCLLVPSSGTVLVEGRSTSAWDVIRLRREIGYVIQEVGLFPHLTVERNVSLVPRIEKWPQPRIRDRVKELLQLVGLDSNFAGRYPRELSGGQRQRVGVARALAADPPILLMDEPFGALDPITRAELQREFMALQQRLKKTIMFVTHDMREALRLGDRIALIDKGTLATLQSSQQFLSSRHPLVERYAEAFGTEVPSSAKREIS
jgi:osmoprotectant transport system ATP-binding protein